jgi:prolipoprotein diacylglyceryltransferase
MIFEITSLILVAIFLIVTFPLYPIFTYSYIWNQSPPLFLILTLLGLSIGYYYYKKTRKPEENKARELNLISKRRTYVIYFELIVLFSFICYNILTNPTIQSQFSNITSSSNLRDFVMFSNNGISIFIGVISMIIVYLYFFTNLNKAKYFSDSSELQEKYAEVFWSLFIRV